jgi:hypothetical protein
VAAAARSKAFGAQNEEVLAVIWLQIRRSERRLRARPAAHRPAASGESLRRGSAKLHPAMIGLDVAPVHGRHCMCGRCGTPER